MLSFNLLAKVVSFLTVVPTIQAGFNPSATNNVAVYYGQNSYGRGSSDPLSQKRLSAYCANTDFNIIPLAFLLSLSNPAVNFANAGDNCTAVVGSTLVSCPQLEADIQECQSVYGKTILLSIGGATYTEGGFTSSDKAVAAANNIWAIFGPRQSSTTVVRPFGASVIDGFDFDFESTVSNVVPFANRLRSLMTASSAVTGKNYYFTAAPQCPYPDQAGKDLLQGGVFFDAVFVQFYNNYCGLQSYVAGATIQNNFNFETWDTWAKTVSLNPNVKVFLGIPAYTTAAGSGYTPADRLATIIAYCKTFSSFGGVMMWDMSQAYANAGFLDSVRMALGSSSTPTTTKAATTKGVTTKPGSSTKAGTTNAGTSKAATTKRPGCSSVRATTAATTRRTSVTPSSTPRPSSPVGSSVSTSSRRPASTSAPSTPNNNYVTQWNQCGGSGYTGPTVCEPPLVCKVVSEWWSQCDTAPNNPNPSSAAVTTRRQSQTTAGTTSARNPTATTARTSFLTSIRASSSSSSKKTTSTTRSSSTTRAATTARTSSTPATTRPQSQSPTRVQTSQTPVPTSTLPASSDFVNEWGQCGGTGYTGTTICRAPFTCRILSPWWSQCELPANAPVSTLASTPTPTRAPAATPTPTKSVAGTGTVERWSQCGGEGWTGGTVCIAPYTCQYFGVWYSQCG